MASSARGGAAASVILPGEVGRSGRPTALRSEIRGTPLYGKFGNGTFLFWLLLTNLLLLLLSRRHGHGGMAALHTSCQQHEAHHNKLLSCCIRRFGTPLLVDTSPTASTAQKAQEIPGVKYPVGNTRCILINSIQMSGQVVYLTPGIPNGVFQMVYLLSFVRSVVVLALLSHYRQLQ
jgi:hypothetical protein